MNDACNLCRPLKTGYATIRSCYTISATIAAPLHTAESVGLGVR